MCTWYHAKYFTCIIYIGVWQMMAHSQIQPTIWYIFKWLKKFKRIVFVTSEKYLKFKFVSNKSCLLSYILWMAAFTLQQQNWVVMTETIGPQSLKYLSSETLQKVCWPLIYITYLPNYPATTAFSPLFPDEKIDTTEVKWLTQGHSVSTQQSWDLNPVLSDSTVHSLSETPCCRSLIFLEM